MSEQNEQIPTYKKDYTLLKLMSETSMWTQFDAFPKKNIDNSYTIRINDWNLEYKCPYN